MNKHDIALKTIIALYVASEFSAGFSYGFNQTPQLNIATLNCGSQSEVIEIKSKDVTCISPAAK
jgi:hypothetical protein